MTCRLQLAMLTPELPRCTTDAARTSIGMPRMSWSPLSPAVEGVKARSNQVSQIIQRVVVLAFPRSPG